MRKSTVLLIDDDKFIHKVIGKALSGAYTSIGALSGEEGIAVAKDKKPDVILLDVEMPSMTGYEVCDVLKQNAGTESIPVVFLSSKTSTREKMIGYDVGAADFLTKPCEKEELLAKLNVQCELNLAHKTLVDRAENASQTALSAMTGSSELGQIIQFMENCYTVSSFEKLALSVFKVTNELGLNCCLLFNTAAGEQYFSSKSTVSPLEKELMPALKEAGNRFTDFGRRTQITYPRVALLIKNMPVDDRAKYGRYKDLLPSLLSATDAKIKSLDTEHALVQQGKSISLFFDMVSKTFVEVADSLDKSQTTVVSSMTEMLRDLSMKLPSMGLEEDQEELILQRVEAAIMSTHDLDNQTEAMRGSFASVTRLIEHLSERQKSIVDGILDRNDVQGDEQVCSMDSSSDIELF
ncbi:MAG: response regulator [Gammaproteobacteria bacterium]|nr:response regulator [Gammaproteobacteria bacterium]